MVPYHQPPSLTIQQQIPIHIHIFPHLFYITIPLLTNQLIIHPITKPSQQQQTPLQPYRRRDRHPFRDSCSKSSLFRQRSWWNRCLTGVRAVDLAYTCEICLSPIGRQRFSQDSSDWGLCAPFRGFQCFLVDFEERIIER